MSTSVMAACWPLQMPPTPKAVLISLADNANDQGDCWPSLARICERTCFGKTAVIQAIQWLEENGLLEADRANGRHTRYRVVPSLNTPDLFASRTGARGGPVREADPSARRSNLSASRTGPVREADTNRKEPSVTEKQKQRASAQPPVAKPEGVSEGTWRDWLALRKAKRAPVTETVVAEATREAGKAGMPLERFLTIWCARGSQGLQADWLKPNERAGPHGAAPTPSKTMQGLMALEAIKRGLVRNGNPDGAAEAPLPLVGPDSGT